MDLSGLAGKKTADKTVLITTIFLSYPEQHHVFSVLPRGIKWGFCIPRIIK